MTTLSKLPFHFLAVITALVWGSTFVSSKILLNEGLSPTDIMTIRFLIAYFVMLPFSLKNIGKFSFKSELIFIALGFMGGSLYFLTENIAVKISSASSTVALIVCTNPIFTAFINKLVWRAERIEPNLIVGSLIAFLGTALVVFNGVFILDDNPIVITLSLISSLSWSVYSVLLRVAEQKYSSFEITRKIFLWGVITMLPCYCFYSTGISVEVLQKPTVIVNILFLSLVASLGCYWLWNVITRRIGIVIASNYLYFNPVVALLTAHVVLSEPITIYAIVGCIITVSGVYWCNRKS